VLAERGGLVEHRDLQLAELTARLRILLEEPRELDRAGEPGRARADEDHVHLDRLRVRAPAG
jgi:hypothetical protein